MCLIQKFSFSSKSWIKKFCHVNNFRVSNSFAKVIKDTLGLASRSLARVDLAPPQPSWGGAMNQGLVPVKLVRAGLYPTGMGNADPSQAGVGTFRIFVLT